MKKIALLISIIVSSVLSGLAGVVFVQQYHNFNKLKNLSMGASPVDFQSKINSTDDWYVTSSLISFLGSWINNNTQMKNGDYQSNFVVNLTKNDAKTVTYFNNFEDMFVKSALITNDKVKFSNYFSLVDASSKSNLPSYLKKITNLKILTTKKSEVDFTWDNLFQNVLARIADESVPSSINPPIFLPFLKSHTSIYSPYMDNQLSSETSLFLSWDGFSTATNLKGSIIYKNSLAKVSSNDEQAFNYLNYFLDNYNTLFFFTKSVHDNIVKARDKSSSAPSVPKDELIIPINPIFPGFLLSMIDNLYALLFPSSGATKVPLAYVLSNAIDSFIDDANFAKYNNYASLTGYTLENKIILFSANNDSTFEYFFITILSSYDFVIKKILIPWQKLVLSSTNINSLVENIFGKSINDNSGYLNAINIANEKIINYVNMVIGMLKPYNENSYEKSYYKFKYYTDQINNKSLNSDFNLKSYQGNLANIFTLVTAQLAFYGKGLPTDPWGFSAASANGSLYFLIAIISLIILAAIIYLIIFIIRRINTNKIDDYRVSGHNEPIE